MKITRILFLANAAIAGSMLLGSCIGVPEEETPIGGQQAYIKASNAGVGDVFGFVTAMSADGNTLVVGAPGEASTAASNAADNTLPSAGAVYVYTRSGTTWTQQALLKASNPGASDQFGFALALSSDGSTLAVGAIGEASAATSIGGTQTDNTAANAGAVYVFTRDLNGVWSQQAYVKASNTGAGDQFGFSVALSGDGNTLAVGAIGEDSSASTIGGSQTDNGAAESGAVYVFTGSGATWAQQAYVKASNAGTGDTFGSSVALSSDGNTLGVGAINEASGATGVGGNEADDLTLSAGAVYAYTRSGATWTQQAYVKASNTGAGDQFGTSIALSGDGNTLAVGAAGEDSSATGIGGSETDGAATNAGAVYVYTRSVVTWTQQAYVKASNTGALDRFGSSVSLSDNGNVLAVGAPFESSPASGIDGNQADNTADSAGAVYVYTRISATWTQQTYIKASNTNAGDHFGTSVALSGDDGTLAVGATGEDSSATGVGGNQADNSAPNSGAVYVFQ